MVCWFRFAFALHCFLFILRSVVCWSQFRLTVFELIEGILTDEWVSLKADKNFVCLMHVGCKLQSVTVFPDACESFIASTMKKDLMPNLVTCPQDFLLS